MPIINLQSRLREAGRIRIGEQVATANGKTRPAKLDRFRFTSADIESIQQIAAIYGGEPRRWAGAPVGEYWELYTESKALEVLVPPVDLAFSQWYELWSGGGCVRRCDGVVNMLTESPCSCDADERECSPTTRLGLILKQVQGIGIWRLETHGWKAAGEINGTMNLLRVIQSSGTVSTMVEARLLLEERQVKKDGKTNNFVVPVLDINVSVAELTGKSLPRLAAGVTPIPTEDGELPSIRDQIDTPVPARTRTARSSAALPATGIRPRPAAQVPVTATAPPSGVKLVSEAQGKNIGRLFKKIGGFDERSARIEYIADKFGRSFESTSDLTMTEGSTLIDELMTLAGEEKKEREPQRPTARTAEEPPPMDDGPPLFNDEDEERPF